jgi:pyrimidine deaminase RibD-like protein
MEGKANPNTKLELLSQFEVTPSDVKRYIKMAINEASKKVGADKSQLKVGCAVMTQKGKSFIG